MKLYFIREETVNEALLTAAEYGHLETVKVLVSFGNADVNVRISRYPRFQTPLGEGARYGFTDIYLYLLGKGQYFNFKTIFLNKEFVIF